MSLKQKMTIAARNTAFWAKENAPTILAVTGFALCVGGAIIACKQTPKAVAAKAVAKVNLQNIEEAKASGEVVITDPETNTDSVTTYTNEDYNKDKALVYVSTTKEYLKAYWLPAFMFALGGTCIFYGNNISQKRVKSAYAAYAALAASYENYRKYVKEHYGEQADGDAKSGDTVEEDHVTIMENGSTYNIDDLYLTKDAGGYSPFALVFDNTNLNYKEDAVANRGFLDRMQKEANDTLLYMRRMTFNEVAAKLLDVPMKLLPLEGQFFGWDLDDPEGAHQITFGHDNPFLSSSKHFMACDTPKVILDFNCKNISKSYNKVLIQRKLKAPKDVIV